MARLERCGASNSIFLDSIFLSLMRASLKKITELDNHFSVKSIKYFVKV